jgi:serine/threonine protein kinase
LNDESRPPEGELGWTPKPSMAPMVAASAAQRERALAERESNASDEHRGFTQGARIGGYVLEECIGQGGMARVYRAEHEGLQRQVALKVLLETPGGAAAGHERFLREARIAAAIKHRNVVNIFDVGVDRGTPFLAMELLEGADLDTFMGGKNRLDEATTMDIIVPIASALATVHDAGIVHRDLKPGNIFLARGRNDELEPRLLDFGISKSTTEQLRLTSTHGSVLGTPFYMSPEAAAGGEMTALSDQYALGVVLYECLTGVHPFAASSNFAEIVRRITLGDYTPISTQNPQLSRRMAAIVERAMQLEPARRFADMRAMGRELLLIAGQRTRITWQLSFSDFPERAALVKGSVLNLTRPLPLVHPPRRRARYALYALPALLAVLLLGAWQSGRLEPLRGRLATVGARAVAWVDGARERIGDLADHRRSVEPAHADLPVRTLALEPTPASHALASAASIPATIAAPHPGELGLGASSSPASTAEASMVDAASDTTSPNTTPHPIAPALSRALKGSPTRTRSASGRRAVKAKAKGSAPATAPSPSLELGTNNAPILD